MKVVLTPECAPCYFQRREAANYAKWERVERKKAEPCHACKARTIWATGQRLPAGIPEGP